MRLVFRLAIALLVLLSVALGLLAVALPRLIGSEELQASLRASASEALGVAVDWDELDAGLLPPRLVVRAPRIVPPGSGPEEDVAAPARLRAGTIDLRLSLRSLLQRRVVVDSLVIHELDLLAMRTKDGIELPLGGASAPPDPPDPPDPAPDPVPAETGAPPADDGSSTGTGLGIALRHFAIEDGRIALLDRSPARPVEWQLDSFRLEGREEESDGSVPIALETRLSVDGQQAGSLRAAGRVARSGAYDLTVDLDRLALAALGPYLEPQGEASEAPDGVAPAAVSLAGAVTGRVSLRGTAAAIESTSADLRVGDLAAAWGGATLRGALSVEAEQRPDAPLGFRAKLELVDGGAASIDATRTDAGGLAADLRLDAVELAPLSPLLGAERRLGGRATGALALGTRAEGGLARVEGTLAVAGARFAQEALDLAGRLDLVLALERQTPAMPIQGELRAVLEEARIASEPLDLRGRLELRARRADPIPPAPAGPPSPPGVGGVPGTPGGVAPIALDGTLALLEGGRVAWTGTATEEGVLDLEATLDAFDLAIAQPFLPDPAIRLGGRATGKARLAGPWRAPELLSLDVDIQSGRVEAPDYGLEGPLRLVARLRMPLGPREGQVDLDLGRARLAWRDAFRKPAGVRASVSTKLLPAAAGGTAFESRVALHSADRLVVKGRLGASSSFVATSPPFELAGWGELWPALAPLAANGSLAIEGFGAVLGEQGPPRFEGRLALREVGVDVAGLGRVRLRGALVGEGAALGSEGLVATIDGVALALEARVEEPLGAARFALAVETAGPTEANDLVSVLTSRRDTLFGPLRLGGTLRGDLADPDRFYEALEGDLRFDVGDPGGGRLRGVSLLRTVLDQLPLLGVVSRLAQPVGGGLAVDGWFTEYFDRLEGDFEIGGGRLTARTLRLVYPGYEATLVGPLALPDLTLDMKGELVLKADLVTALRGAAGVGAMERKPIRIPLARVRGRVGAPEVSLTAETLAAVPQLLFQATGLDTLSTGVGRAIGRLLGEGD